MDRKQMWKRIRLCLRHRNRSHSLHSQPLHTQLTLTHDSMPRLQYMRGMRHFSYFMSAAAGLTQRPKVLLDVDCSNLLMGGSDLYENFSSTCWLEDHLHHFGLPENHSPEHNSSSEFQDSSDLEVSSSSEELAESYSSSTDEYDMGMSGTNSFTEWSGHSSNVINLYRFPYLDSGLTFIEPPPYPNEPPPSYEEAIASSGFIENEETDFLW